MRGNNLIRSIRAETGHGNAIGRSGIAVALAAGLVPVILATTAAQAQNASRFSVSPRFYAISVTGPDQNKPLSMTLGGLSASVSVAPQWDITATGLHGGGDTASFDGTRKIEAERTDFELVARYRVPESPLYLTGGYRNIGVDEETSQLGTRFSESSVRIQAASARYRVISVRVWVDDVESESFLHGPEIALTFRF